jgi:ATP-binding cassette subfamily C (CFTR/MRP) protein 1
MFTGKPETKYTLPWATIKAYKGTLFLGVPFRLAMIAMGYCQPFLISRTISFVMEPTTESSKDVGYELVAGAVLIYVGLAVSPNTLN